MSMHCSCQWSSLVYQKAYGAWQKRPSRHDNKQLWEAWRNKNLMPRDTILPCSFLQCHWQASWHQERMA
jgi:hypothetical protein